MITPSDKKISLIPVNDINELINSFGIIGAAAGSLFVFKGVYRAVLINYISDEERKRIV